MSCPEEQVTKHYKGDGFGYGPVLDVEILILAVPIDAPRNGTRLAPTAFSQGYNNKQLNRGELSVARVSHANIEEFNSSVVTALGGATRIAGVVSCSASVIRKISHPHNIEFTPTCSQDICVLDRVSAFDKDWHASLQYCFRQRQIVDPKFKGRLRAAISMSLASAFGDIQGVNEVFSP